MDKVNKNVNQKRLTEDKKVLGEKAEIFKTKGKSYTKLNIGD